MTRLATTTSTYMWGPSNGVTYYGTGGTYHINIDESNTQTVIAEVTSESGENIPRVTLEKKTTKEGIGVKLYFTYIKSKLTVIQKKKLEKRIEKLYQLVEETKELGQDGLMEETAKMLVIAIREQEAFVCGVTQFLDKEVIDKFKDKVKDKPIMFGELKNFPRPIPRNIQKIIKSVKERELFDEYWILYTDYVKEAKKKTNAEKIREKDPVLFGRYKYQPDRYYVIASWIDDHCDITLDKIINTVGIEKASNISDIDAEYIKNLKNFILSKHERLKGTRRDNYKDLEKQDEEETEKFKAMKRVADTMMDEALEPTIKDIVEAVVGVEEANKPTEPEEKRSFWSKFWRHK